jgi:hypothetical protein
MAYFMATLTPDVLMRTVTKTSETLQEKGKHVTTAREILNFCQIFILGTRNQFGSRADF